MAYGEKQVGVTGLIVSWGKKEWVRRGKRGERCRKALASMKERPLFQAG